MVTPRRGRTGLKPNDNFEAVVSPAITDDRDAGYVVGSRWINTVLQVHFVCVSNAPGAAVWVPMVSVTRLFYSDQLDNPNNSNWAVNALAPAVGDTANPALVVRRFDDTIEEGVGWILSAPPRSSLMTLTLKSRAQTAPGAAVAVVPRLYLREIPDNAAVGAWSAGLNLTALAIPTNVNFQYDAQTFTFASLGMTAGRLYQYELTRLGTNPSDTLTGDWDLLELGVEFA